MRIRWDGFDDGPLNTHKLIVKSPNAITLRMYCALVNGTQHTNLPFQ